jgi:hypothetical protein
MRRILVLVLACLVLAGCEATDANRQHADQVGELKVYESGK